MAGKYTGGKPQVLEEAQPQLPSETSWDDIPTGELDFGNDYAEEEADIGYTAPPPPGPGYAPGHSGGVGFNPQLAARGAQQQSTVDELAAKLSAADPYSPSKESANNHFNDNLDRINENVKPVVDPMKYQQAVDFNNRLNSVENSLGLDKFQDEPIVDAQGNLITDPSAKRRIAAQEAIKAQEAYNRPGTIDFTQYQTILEGTNNVISESDIGKVKTAATKGARFLASTSVTKGQEGGKTGIDSLMQSYNANEQEVVGGYTNALAAVALEVLSGELDPSITDAAEGTNTAGTKQEGEGDFDMFADTRSFMEQAIGDPISFSKGMKEDAFYRRMAAANDLYHRNKKISEGRDLSEMRGVDKNITGQMLGEAAIESGYFRVETGADGTRVVIPTDITKKFETAMRDQQKASIGERNDGRRTYTPANTDTGWYNDYHKGSEFRNKYIPRYKNTSLMDAYPAPDGNEALRGTMRDVVDYQAKLGSVFYFPEARRVGGLALLISLFNAQSSGKLPFDLTSPASDFLQLGEARLKGIEERAGGGEYGMRKMEAEAKKTINKIHQTLLTSAEISNARPETNYHKGDPQVWRFYPENLAVEVQNSLFNRAIMGNPLSNPMKVSAQELKDLKGMAAFAEKYFFDNYMKGGKIQRKDMAILSNLLAIHKNLSGKAGEEMTFRARVEALTAYGSDSFIAKNARIGMHLENVLNKLGLYDGKKVSPDAIKQFEVGGRNTLPELTQDEMDAINTWLGNSDKKTWGFVLSSYLGLSDLAKAVANGTHWDPKVQADMDMNSAGRAYISMDVGNTETLERVGIIYNEKQGLLGGPRKLFFDQFMKKLDTDKNRFSLGYIFENSYAETDSEKVAIADALHTEFKKLGAQYGAKFYDKIGKTTLLTDDYGKHIMFHFEEALTILESYPTIGEVLAPFYDSRMDMTRDLNSFLSGVLRSEYDQWNKELPKDMSEMLLYLGRFPEPVGMFNEPIPIGATSMFEREGGTETLIKMPSGKTILAKEMERAKDPTAKGKAKRVLDGATGKVELFNPRDNTAIPNQIGPILGQYRESATMINAVNSVNPRVSELPHWVAVVHDNLVVDGNGFANYFFAVNDKKNGSARKVLEYDFMGEFIQDFNRQVADFGRQLKTNADSGGLDLGMRGENAAMGRRAQYLYDMLADADEDFKKTASYKSKKSELDMYEQMGWYPDQSNGGQPPKSIFIPTSRLRNISFTVTRQAPFNSREEQSKSGMNFIAALMYLRGIPEKAERFISLTGTLDSPSALKAKKDALEEIDRMKERLMYFFT